MIHTIQNAYLTVSASAKGAELQSILGADGTEYLWQGDPKYWEDQAINIFPFVARLVNGKYFLDGKEYSMRIHGIAHYYPFTLEEKTDTKMVLVLKANDATRKEYPREFVFRVIYALHGSTLEVVYQVENHDKKTMHFGLGGHPGFNVPLVPDLDFSDYRLRFNEPAMAQRIYFTDDHFVTDRRIPYTLERHDTIALQHNLFDRDAIVLENMARQVTLETDKDNHKVTISYPQMPYVGFWHANQTDAPYLCVEPWCSLPADAGKATVLEEQENLLRLESNQTYTNGWHITVE